MNDIPSTARDVVVTLPDGSKAYGYYLSLSGFRWWVYPNEYPSNDLDINAWDATPGAVVSWSEIE